MQRVTCFFIDHTLMKLNKINDFRVQPAWSEYLFLYSVTAISSIMLGLSLLDKISGLYGWLAFILIISVSYIYSVIKRIRDTRAKQYYLNTIKDYSVPELQQILRRQQKSKNEYMIITRRINYLQQTFNDH